MHLAPGQDRKKLKLQVLPRLVIQWEEHAPHMMP
jgi:hypothetical protein